MDLGLKEATFVELEGDAGNPQQSQDSFGVFPGLLLCVLNDDDIFEVYKENMLSDARQNDIKRALKGGRWHFQPKWHP